MITLELLDADEAARRLGVCRREFNKFFDSGRIFGWRNNVDLGERYVSEESIKAFIESRKGEW